MEVVTRIALLASALCISALLPAQSIGTWDIGIQAMHSPASSAPDIFFGGQTSGITHSGVALRATTDLLRLGRVHLRYSAQLLPIMRLGGVERYETLSTGTSTTYVLGGTAAAYGVGVVPIGLDVAADVSHRVRLQLGVGAGIARFSQHVPVAGSRHRAFTAEMDGTVLLDVGRDRWLNFGLRMKHVSNGLTAWENPGVDNRMLFAGMSWRFRAPR
jgi:Lipid A 3-O-deacylase (PagL)